MRPPAKKSRTTPFGPRPVTATYLRNAAMHYLSGRSASEVMLRQTLERRAKKRLAVRALPEDTTALIAAALAEMIALRLVDDVKFAEGRAASLARKGLGRRRIALGLRQKGIVGDKIEAAMAPDLDELTQARRFAERKRLGTWRRDGGSRETRDKDLRALARAGFSYGIASKALEQPEADTE